MEKFYLVREKEDRPAFPGNWIICNAPRPIMGHHEWQGEFIHGVFYAVIAPDMEHAEDMMETNRKLDAWQLVYTDFESARAAVKLRYPRYADKIDRLTDSQIIETYHVLKNER